MNMNTVSTLPLLSTDNTQYKSSERCDHAAFSQLFEDSKQTVANEEESSKKENFEVAFNHCIRGQALEGIDQLKEVALDNEDKASDEDEKTSAAFSAALVSSDVRAMPYDLSDKVNQSDKFLKAIIREKSPDFAAASKKSAGDFQWLKINKKAEMINGIVQTFSKRGFTADKYSQSTGIEVFQQTAVSSVNQKVQSVMPAAPNLNISMSSATAPISGIPVATCAAEWLAPLTERITFLNRHEIQQAEIRLHPEELGSLHIQLAMQKGKMHLNVAVMHSMVKSVLESALPHLRTSLIEQGIALQDMNVSDLSSTAWHGDDASLFNQSSHTDSKLPASLTDEKDEVVNTEKILPSSAQSGMSVFV